MIKLLKSREHSRKLQHAYATRILLDKQERLLNVQISIIDYKIAMTNQKQEKL